MNELKKILQQAIEKNACAAQLEPFKRFIKQGDELSAWQTVLGNLGWLEDNEIEVPDNLEQLAQNQGKRWDENGNLWLLEFYKNGKLHGEKKIWHENGTLMWHEFYENGLIHGEYKEWYPDETLRVQSFFENGKLHGERKIWNPDGSLCDHELWENGKIIKSLL